MEMKELSLDEMEQVSGGMRRPVNTGTSRDAAFRSGPGKSYPELCGIPNGTKVDTIGRETVWDPESGLNYVQVMYNGMEGWIDASIVGMR